MPMYESDVVLGKKYRDTQTGFAGTAIYVSFHQHACERIALEAMHDGELKAYEFDAPRLEPVNEAPPKPQAQPLAARGTGPAPTRIDRSAVRR